MDNRKIKYLVMDVDGTLTDGKIYIGNEGELFKSFNVKDGYGICDILPKYGVCPIIITGRESKILETRCQELNITYLYQGVKNKAQKIGDILKKLNGSYFQVAYIGDDMNDFDCMNLVKQNGGIVGCPADSALKILEISNYITKKNGGNGAVREFIEWLLFKQGEN